MNTVNFQSVSELLFSKCLENPTKDFILFEDKSGLIESLNYKSFEMKVKQLGSVLINNGIQKGDKVLLHLPNGIDFTISWFAILSIGAVMVPTNILSTKEEIKYLVSHSESQLIITEKEFEEKFLNFKHLPLLFSRLKDGQGGTSLDKEMEQSVLLDRFPTLSSNDEAAILYTSGTTSKPKGVVLTHRNYLHTGEKMAERLNLTSSDRTLIVLPMFHGNGQYYMAMPALYAGASIAIAEQFSATNYIKQAKRMGATVGSLFSAPIKMVLKKDYDPEDADNNLRLIIYAQSITDQQYKDFTARYNTPLRQLYGMTETIAVPLINSLNGFNDSTSIGEEACGYKVKLRNDKGEEVIDGEEGEITVFGIPGETIMKEYYKNEQETAKAIQNNWLYTGDIARKDPLTGLFYFVDRKKDMMKRSGENIAAGEVESVINDHEAVFESAVISLPDPIYEESIHAFIILKENTTVTEGEIILWCQQRLAKFKIPQAVYIVKEFPRTSVGKIQKQQLKTWI